MNSRRVCVYTAMFDGYDRILEHVAQSVQCDFLVFTDDLGAVPQSMQTVITQEPGGQTLPGPKNAWLRLFPFESRELDEYDLIIYIDANVRIVNPYLVEWILARCERIGNVFDLMLSVHPWNVCAYQEARDSRTMAKYANTDLKDRRSSTGTRDSLLLLGCSGTAS